MLYLYVKEIDFKTKVVKKPRKQLLFKDQGKIHQEDITIVNLYAHNNRAPNAIYILKNC
jgi:hypothetical protein